MVLQRQLVFDSVFLANEPPIPLPMPIESNSNIDLRDLPYHTAGANE